MNTTTIANNIKQIMTNYDSKLTHAVSNELS